MPSVEVLNTKLENRDPYLQPELAAFPYVNGGLFANEKFEIPNFTEDIKTLLLTKASADFDWSDISPTIFGAVFESTLNPETRRKGGMHYTSIENIHKVIDPLFMDELKEEFNQIKNLPQNKTRDKKLEEFQNKIAELNFLDPACGSGNFLTETYISLRKLENDIIFELQKGQITLGMIKNPIKVSIGQFYGIEINDFAVTVAKTALWIAESQMMKKTEDIVHMDLDFLPLKTYANIIEGNAFGSAYVCIRLQSIAGNNSGLHVLAAFVVRNCSSGTGQGRILDNNFCCSQVSCGGAFAEDDAVSCAADNGQAVNGQALLSADDTLCAGSFADIDGQILDGSAVDLTEETHTVTVILLLG